MRAGLDGGLAAADFEARFRRANVLQREPGTTCKGAAAPVSREHSATAVRVSRVVERVTVAVVRVRVGARIRNSNGAERVRVARNGELGLRKNNGSHEHLLLPN